MEKLKEKQNRKKEKKTNKEKELSTEALAEEQARKEAERLAAIIPGCSVKIKGQTSIGEVMEINGKNAIVAFGSIKTSNWIDWNVPTRNLNRQMPLPKTPLSVVRRKIACTKRNCILSKILMYVACVGMKHYRQ